MIGKVKWFDSKKGYGFILTEEGQEIFVHYTGIVAEGFRALTEGQNVEFEIGSNEKGQQAMADNPQLWNEMGFNTLSAR